MWNRGDKKGEVEQERREGTCEKGREAGVLEDIWATLVCFNRLHNMRRVCHLGCPAAAAAALLGNTTAVKWCRELYCRTCYYSPRATLSSFASTAGRPTNPPFFFFFFGNIFQIFAANRPHRLNQLNLSPIIKSDYKHFRAPRPVSRQLSCRWFPDLFLVPHNFQLSGLRKFSQTAIKRNPRIHLQQPGPIVVLITQ